MSINAAGAKARKFSIGPRVCPPASTFPSSPHSRSSPSVSSADLGSKYLNCAGFTALLFFSSDDLLQKCVNLLALAGIQVRKHLIGDHRDDVDLALSGFLP